MLSILFLLAKIKKTCSIYGTGLNNNQSIEEPDY